MRTEAVVDQDGLKQVLDGSIETMPRRRPRVALTGGALVGVAVVLAALNLRPAISSVGPMLDQMRGALGASAVWAGVLTTLPGLCFALAGLCAPLVARRIGTVGTVGVALAVLTCGLLLRVLDGKYVVLGGTLIATSAIAFANVLIPVVVKSSFPARIGLMTGIYTAALQAGGAFGSALTPPLGALAGNGDGGWRQALGAWSVLAAAALVLWVVAARTRSTVVDPENPSDGPRRSLFGSPLAWVMTLFFGLQSLLAYVVMGWLPQVLMDAGVSRGQAGLLLGLVSIIAVPISLTVPALASRQRSQTWWIVGLSAFAMAGILGLMLAPGAAPLLWSVLLGIGMSVFSMALTTIALRARNASDTAALSGMVQGIGYLLAAVGPFLFSLLHDLSGGWTLPFGMLVVAMAIQTVAGAISGRPRYV